MKSSELELRMILHEKLRIGASHELCNGSWRAQNWSFTWSLQWIMKSSESKLQMDFPMDCKGIRIGASVWQCFIEPLSPKKAENHHCLWSITKTELLLWQFTNGCTKLACCKPSLKLSSFANHHWNPQTLQTITEALKLSKPSLKLSSFANNYWTSQALQTVSEALKLWAW
jgi:hypothetical protein